MTITTPIGEVAGKARRASRANAVEVLPMLGGYRAFCLEASAANLGDSGMTIEIESEPVLPKLVNMAQVMEATTLSRASIYNYIKSGDIKPVKFGKRIAFLDSQIKSFINAKIAASQAA